MIRRKARGVIALVAATLGLFLLPQAANAAEPASSAAGHPAVAAPLPKGVSLAVVKASAKATAPQRRVGMEVPLTVMTNESGQSLTVNKIVAWDYNGWTVVDQPLPQTPLTLDPGESLVVQGFIPYAFDWDGVTVDATDSKRRRGGNRWGVQ